MPWRPTSIHATSRVEDDTMETHWLGQAIVLVLSPAGLTTCTTWTPRGLHVDSTWHRDSADMFHQHGRSDGWTVG